MILSTVEPRSWCHWSASIGAGAWLLFVALARPGWAGALFLFAPLVLVPLALAVLTAVDRRIRYPRRWAVVVALQPVAALILLGSFAVPVGAGAAALTVPWLLFTGLIAIAGVAHAWPIRQRSFDELCMYAGMTFLPIGAGWLFLSRLGARPLGFSDVIVLATAVHFHYAGFVLPLLTGLVGRMLPGWGARLAALGVVAGVPLVAAGITLSAFEVRWPEWLAAWLLAGACFLTAGLQLRLAIRVQRGLARWLLAISSLALLCGMGLAGTYALGSFNGSAWLTIEDMLPTHGAINAFGFALCGLVGWDRALATTPAGGEAPAPLQWRNGRNHYRTSRSNILRLDQ